MHHAPHWAEGVVVALQTIRVPANVTGVSGKRSGVLCRVTMLASLDLGRALDFLGVNLYPTAFRLHA